MDIFINGIERNLTSNLTLEILLNKLDCANKKIAVEVNGEIIPRSHVKNRLIVDGDKIEIINAVGGG